MKIERFGSAARSGCWVNVVVVCTLLCKDSCDLLLFSLLLKRVYTRDGQYWYGSGAVYADAIEALSTGSQ